MKFNNKITGRLMIGIFLVSTALAVSYAARMQPARIVEEAVTSDLYGTISLARPLPGYQDLVLVYADTKKYQADKLALRIAQAGDAVAVVDTDRALRTFTGKDCLNADRIMEPLAILSTWAKASPGKQSILAGLEGSSLLPLLAALTNSGGASNNLSVGFSVTLPAGVTVCPPLATEQGQQGGQVLRASSLPLKGNWQVAWADQPDPVTGIFVRGIAGAQTTIEPYNTPMDSVLVNEIARIKEKSGSSQANAWPLVEVPAPSPNDTVTLFYSGDGGWRDLDRAVAGQMANLGFPVVGVDALRAFWSGKSPARTAAELSAIMAYYRTAWKAKKFILAGFSFGADILPAVYNLLPEADREDIPMLVLLSLGTNADFEIHVSGWVSTSSNGLPILPELSRIPGNKILCIFGQEERSNSACATLSTPGAHLLELPGGHHFDQDYAHLATRIIDIYKQAGLADGK